MSTQALECTASPALPEINPGASSTRAWWAVMARFLIHGLVISTWVSRIPFVKGTLHLSDGAFGFTLLGMAVGSVIGIPVCGWLVTRYGSRRACIWTSIGLCLSLVAPALAFNAVTLFAALLVFGAMAGSNDVAMNSQAVAVEKRIGTPTMSRFHAMFSVGGIAGAAAGGLLAARAVPAPLHFLVVAVLVSLFSLSTAPLLMETGSESLDRPRPRLSLRHFPITLLVLCAIGFCIFLSEGAIADWTAIYLKQVLSAGPGLAAAGYAVFSFAMAISRLGGDAVTVRLGPAWTIRAGAILAACGLTSALLVHSPYWALPGFALVGAGFSSIIPLVFAAGGRIKSIGEGAGVAAVSGLGYLGFLVGPPVIGLISQFTSLRIGLAFVVLLSVLAASLVRPAKI
ncbi:MAG TPA: MFS transporter [Bryobacteraceae bacterium]